MKATLATLLLLSSLTAAATKLEIHYMTASQKADTKKEACAKALNHFKQKVKQGCDDLGGELTNEWDLNLNYNGSDLPVCTIKGSGSCEVGL